MKTLILYAVGTLAACAQLTFDQSEILVTPKPDQTSITVDFPFTNKTEKEIVIASSRPLCSCMTISASSQKIPAAGKGTIRATLDLTNLLGDVTKGAEIHIAGIEKPQLITVKAHVPEMVLPSPRTLEWTAEEPRNMKTLRLTMQDEKPIKVLRVQLLNPSFDWKLRVVEEGKIYEIDVTPPKEKNSSVVLAKMEIDTDCSLERHKKKVCFVLLRPSANR